MRIEPVYLVAPKPTLPSVPKRRAFLWVAAGVVVGAIGGGGCGYAVGVASSKSDPEENGGEQGAESSKPGLPPTSGNAELDELRRLALVAPIAELADKWLYFLDEFGKTYRTDAHLPNGVQRLIDFTVGESPQSRDRAIRATLLRDIIQRGEATTKARFENRIEELERAIR